MKKFLTVLLAFLLTICTVGLFACTESPNNSGNPGGEPPEQEQPSDGSGEATQPNTDPLATLGLAYQLDAEGTYICTGIGTATDTNIVIASTYYNKPVTGIAEEAFRDNQTIKSITLPDSIITIGGYAFSGCKEIESLEIPASVMNMSWHAFSACTKLATVTFEADSELESIGYSAFNGCTSLKNIVIPASVMSMGDFIFRNCSGLESITLSENINRLGHIAFENCTSLTSINYGGTIYDWENVDKDAEWDNNTGNYTVHCSDGDVAKA